MVVETLDAATYLQRPTIHGMAGNVKIEWGLFDFGVVVIEAGDRRRLVKIGPKCLLMGGWLWAGDLDTGTETVDIDIGWDANGDGAATYTMAEGVTFTNAGSVADPDGLVNSGLLSGDAMLDLVAAGNNYRPFPMVAGPLYFSRETTIVATVNAGAATPASGKMYVALLCRLI